MDVEIRRAIEDAWRGVTSDDVATDDDDDLGSDDVPRLHASQLGVLGSAAYRARVREAYGDETCSWEVAWDAPRGMRPDPARIATAAIGWARRWLAANPTLGLRITLRLPCVRRLAPRTWTLREASEAPAAQS